MMFERAHHQRIARVLDALDGQLLCEAHCLFGGGTAIALRFGEYRESVDIDFLVSDVASYRNLRQLLTGPAGFAGLLRAGAEVFTQTRELRADQYGIRTSLLVVEQPIKFEIVLEGRIELAAPAATDEVCGIASLTPLDMATSKLLANSDRWADDGVFSRDVIDLAMMHPPCRYYAKQSPRQSWLTGNQSAAISARPLRRFTTVTGGWSVACKRWR